jgi:hypothetical protein
MSMGVWILLGATAASVLTIVVVVAKRLHRGTDHGTVSEQWLAEQRIAADDHYR